MHGGDLTEEVFAKFIDLIYKVAGIKIPNTKKVMMSNRLRRRLRATGIADFQEYYRFLTPTSGALDAFVPQRDPRPTRPISIETPIISTG